MEGHGGSRQGEEHVKPEDEVLLFGELELEAPELLMLATAERDSGFGNYFEPGFGLGHEVEGPGAYRDVGVGGDIHFENSYCVYTGQDRDRGFGAGADAAAADAAAAAAAAAAAPVDDIPHGYCIAVAGDVGMAGHLGRGDIGEHGLECHSDVYWGVAGRSSRHCYSAQEGHLDMPYNSWREVLNSIFWTRFGPLAFLVWSMVLSRQYSHCH